MWLPTHGLRTPCPTSAQQTWTPPLTPHWSPDLESCDQVLVFPFSVSTSERPRCQERSVLLRFQRHAIHERLCYDVSLSRNTSECKADVPSKPKSVCNARRQEKEGGKNLSKTCHLPRQRCRYRSRVDCISLQNATSRKREKRLRLSLPHEKRRGIPAKQIRAVLKKVNGQRPRLLSSFSEGQVKLRQPTVIQSRLTRLSKLLHSEGAWEPNLHEKKQGLVFRIHQFLRCKSGRNTLNQPGSCSRKRINLAGRKRSCVRSTVDVSIRGSTGTGPGCDSGGP